jgi:predicted outer membrane protein
VQRRIHASFPRDCARHGGNVHGRRHDPPHQHHHFPRQRSRVASPLALPLPTSRGGETGRESGRGLARHHGLGLACPAACVATHPGFSDIADYAETPSEYHLHAYGRAGEVTQSDRYFVFRAGVADLYDIALADLTAEKSINPAIVQFAERRRGDAVTSHARLMRVAEQHIGIGPPRLLDRDHAIAREQLAILSGSAFDDAYIRDVLRRSDAAIALYAQEARFGGEPILARFAADGVPRLAQEKEVAERLAARVVR